MINDYETKRELVSYHQEEPDPGIFLKNQFKELIDGAFREHFWELEHLMPLAREAMEDILTRDKKQPGDENKIAIWKELGRRHVVSIPSFSHTHVSAAKESTKEREIPEPPKITKEELLESTVKALTWMKEADEWKEKQSEATREKQIIEADFKSL